MGFVTRSAPAYGTLQRFVKLALGGRPASGSRDSVYGGRHVIRRSLPYLAAVGAVGVVSLGLALLAWGLGIPPVEPTAAHSFSPPPVAGFGIGSASDVVRLVTGILAAAVVIQFVHVSRRHESLLRRRKDLLQDVSPRIVQSLDAEEVLNTVAEATLKVIDYQHFRLYRWDESSERLILVKSVARAESYEQTDWYTVTLSLGEGITGIAAQSRRSFLVPDASVDSRMVYPAGTTRIPEGIISVPMGTGNRLVG